MHMHDGNRKKVKIVLGIIIALLLAGIIYILFFYYHSCENIACYNDYLRDCKKSTYVYQSNMSFEYKILGKSSGNCSVSVKLIKGDFNNQDSLELEKQSMTCSIPLGVVMFPEQDLENCHGMLKEGMQNLIIQKLHAYIVQNLGKISV